MAVDRLKLNIKQHNLNEILVKIAYVTTFNARDLNSSDNWAGTGYYIPRSLEQQSLSLEYIGSLKQNLDSQIICKFKKYYHEIFSPGKYLKPLDPLILKNYANRVECELKKAEVDVVFSATIAPISQLECKQPIVFWADATFENLLDFYPQFTDLCEESIQHGHLMEKLALDKCKLAIYASDWAAQSAINYYQADPSKVKVVPFGANIEQHRTFDEIKEAIDSRPANKCKLLFIGYDWVRKGGDIAVALTKTLNDIGLETELTAIGCSPHIDAAVVPYVKTLGIISKSTASGRAELDRLLTESHFLIMPSQAECYGIVFCEAGSFGVPCLSAKVGGIPTVIKDNINGKLFDTGEGIAEYRDYVLKLFSNYEEYNELAISSFNEYQSRLNWLVAGSTVKDLLQTIV